MKRNFNIWVNNMKESVADWSYYTDFNKVYNNVNKYKIELNILNSLVNSQDIENDFVNLVNKYPEVLKVIPLLLAKREKEIRIIDKGIDRNYNFDKMNYDIEDYVLFMRKTGLFDLISKNIISDLLDYAKGVEVGLDTNARKNRTGIAMENIVESFIIESGFIKDVTYFKEMKKSEIEEKFDIILDLQSINESRAEKRFDFVVINQGKIFAIEVNFYSGGGSKLNETARSYKMLAVETEEIENFEFVWITDGKGWKTARRNLEETFDILKHMYNLNDLENNDLKDLLK